MPHCNLIGNIYFSNIPDTNELTDFSFYLTQKAIDHRLGINIYCNLSDYCYKFNPLKPFNETGYIPYQILDNPWTNECFELFKGIWGTSNGKIENIRQSHLRRLQEFFEVIITHELISYLTIYFQDKHGDDKIIIYDYEIKASQLCECLENVPNSENGLEFPAARIKIIK